MGILAAREISRFKGIGLCERHRWYRFPNIGFSLPPRSFLFLLRSVPHRGNDLAFISPSGSGYFVTAGPSRCLSLLLPSSVEPPRRDERAIFDKLLDKRDAERDQLSPSSPTHSRQLFAVFDLDIPHPPVDTETVSMIHRTW